MSQWFQRGSDNWMVKLWPFVESLVFKPWLEFWPNHDLNTGKNTLGIWNPSIKKPETLKIRTYRRSNLKCVVQFWKGRNWTVKKSDIFIPISNLTKLEPFVWISNGWASRFRSRLKSGPFPNWPLFYHSKFECVQISDSNCSLVFRC